MRVSTTLAMLFGLAISASPVLAQAKAKSSAQSICKDGTTSTTTGRGACSSHGGVDTLATAAAKQSAKAAKARATATKTSGDSVKAAAADSKAKPAEAKAVRAEDKADKDSTGATAQPSPQVRRALTVRPLVTSTSTRAL
jgi:hypothetical protein